MKRLIMLFFAAVLISFTTTAQNSSDVKAQIEENSKLMQDAINDGDLEKFGLYFTEDAMFKMSGQQPLSGRSAVTSAHKPMTDQQMKLVINTEEIMDFGDFAHEIGNYELHTKDGQIVDHGHYSTLWKKVDGEWKIFRDVISTSVAMK